MSTSTFVGNSDGLVTGLCPAPPPPPPPPPVPGQVPAMRINTVEPPTIRRPQIVSNDGYEPPAAIQNAMLTKDKKPFTYTPGMGGKLDLSQIRSPRMARRVAKNANDEGIEGPPKSAIETKPTPAPNSGPNLFVQPQVAIPVFPTNVPVQPSANRTPPTPAGNRTPPTPPANRTPPTPPANRTPPMSPGVKTPTNGSERQLEPPKPVTKLETKVTPVASVQPSSPDSPGTPTQVTLAKAPTPWLQNKNKPPEELPEWAKRSSMNKQSSSPESPTSPPVYVPVQQAQQQPPQWQQTQQKQQPVQQRPQSQQPQQYQYQQPQQFNQQQRRPYSTPPVTQQASPQGQQQERMVPIRIEDRPSVFDVARESGHHQFKQPSPHHQQRWGQQPVQNQVLNQVQQQPVASPQPQQSSGGAFVIPIMVEGSDRKPVGGPASNASYSQPVVRNNTSNVENQTVKVIPQRGPVALQSDGGPVQSRSFRVLQKITDTDSMDDIEPDQLRKLQLTEDDKNLMNRIREQVDNDTFLHHEEDPRYRGAAIPSRAFRFLQTMTESGEVPVTSTTPRPPSAINKRQNRNSKTFEETQTNLPPSEQQVPEPKKYMGSAIPSRSFRILQAMTAPESVATQENRQADYTCQTENNVPGNQQGVFLPPCPPPFWSPDGGWWGYYPLPCPGATNDSYSYHPENTAYIYFPIYNQNHPGYPQYGTEASDSGKNACSNVYPPSYVIPVPPPSNCSHACAQATDSMTGPKIEPVASVSNKGSEGKVPKDSGDLNGLNSVPQWDRASSVSRTASTISKDSDCTTAMNITDEEEIPETIPVSKANESVHKAESLEKKPCPNGSLNVTVPNYTYIDTSDSSDSTDSESQSDNESIIESSKGDSDSEETSSDSDDSDSYLAYSTGLNPHGRLEKDAERSGTNNSSSKESCNSRDESESSSEKNNSDSEEEEQMERDEGKPNAETFPHKLSVIYEDIEQMDSEGPRPQEARTVRGWNGTPFEATDDPPDEQDTTTVSVSLPLRFKFSVSENNEDVTTVIVGDSTIKPERPCSKDDGRVLRSQEHRDRINEVSANFQVSSDTSVDFTVKKEAFDVKERAKSHSNEREKEEVVKRKLEKSEEPVVPHVNFTLRKIPTRLSRVNCEETVETEFTIKSRRSSAKKEESKSEKEREDRSLNVNPPSCKGGDSLSKEKTFKTLDSPTHTVRVDEPTFETHDYNKNVLKPEVIVSDYKHTPANYHKTHLKTVQEIPHENGNSLREEGNEEDVEEKMKEAKHLLSVQNSRDETDDEDSGVTSDMSRMISEVDTDSECTSSKNMRKYQRTQTHSRLFKLLNDDSILAEDTEQSTEHPSRRNYLSLPLKNNTNYDDSYCSNYSSCHTSPDYSPVCEQSWRRLHDSDNSVLTSSPSLTEQSGEAFRQGHLLTRQERVICKDDPYYQAWKTSKSPAPNDHDVIPSQAFKILESRRPLWAYKVNVLCPRIKSTKNVPQTLENRKTTDSSILPPPTPNPLIAPSPILTPLTPVTLRSDYC